MRTSTRRGAWRSATGLDERVRQPATFVPFLNVSPRIPLRKAPRYPAGELRLNHYLILASALSLLLVAHVVCATTRTGVLYSQVGYDTNAPVRVVLRGDSNYIADGAQWFLLSSKGDTVSTDTIRYWGEQWEDHWWIADCGSDIPAGQYQLSVRAANDTLLATDTFSVAAELLWNSTWRPVAVEQLTERAQRARFLQGWKASGGKMREAHAHEVMLIGLCDVLSYGVDRIPNSDQEFLFYQLLNGTDYLAFLQDEAKRAGFGNGPLIHEYPDRYWVSTGDVAKAAYTFARVAGVVGSTAASKYVEYVERAKKAFDWLDQNGALPPPQDESQYKYDFHARAHGAPEDYEPDTSWKTRDLFMMAWAATLLARLGVDEYKNKAVSYARRAMSRQVLQTGSEDGLWGHFYEYEDHLFTEKAWSHVYYGYDGGDVYPHWVLPLVEMHALWPNHEDAPLWEQTVSNFAYGYFLPACQRNPFGIMPVGYFSGKGLLEFSSLWHGMNGAYAFAAVLGMELGSFLQDSSFVDIAVGNIQWIVGLNAGFPDDTSSFSMIYGVGKRYEGTPSKIRGSICHGLNADGQFNLEPASAGRDGPRAFCDESNIMHAGAWLSALSRLRGTKPAQEIKFPLEWAPLVVEEPISILPRTPACVPRDARVYQWYTSNGRLLRTAHNQSSYYRLPKGFYFKKGQKTLNAGPLLNHSSYLRKHTR